MVLVKGNLKYHFPPNIILIGPNICAPLFSIIMIIFFNLLFEGLL